MNFLKRFWNWLRRKEEPKELIVVHRGHEVSGVERVSRAELRALSNQRAEEPKKE